MDQYRLASAEFGHLDERVVCSSEYHRNCCGFFEGHGVRDFGRDTIVGSSSGCVESHVRRTHAITGLELGCLAACSENNTTGFLTQPSYRNQSHASHDISEISVVSQISICILLYQQCGKGDLLQACSFDLDFNLVVFKRSQHTFVTDKFQSVQMTRLADSESESIILVSQSHKTSGVLQMVADTFVLLVALEIAGNLENTPDLSILVVSAIRFEDAGCK